MTMDDVNLFKYLNEAIDTERFMLYLIGNRDELTLALNYIAKEKVQETYLRPLDVKLLAEHLDSVVEYSAVDESLRKKILIIDDDGTMLRMMRTWLSVKYHVYMASSGKIALSFLAQNPVDLILLDYEMPVASGPQVLGMIRADARFRDIPVFFLTGKNDRDSVMSVMSLKPDGYVIKTAGKQALLEKVNMFFSSRP
jgi:CheY-like chemotaxis protein